MTRKAKLAAVALVCGVLLATLWALPGPTDAGEGGLPRDAARDPGGGRLVAEGEGDKDRPDTATTDDPSERTEVPTQPVVKPRFGSLLVRVVWGEDKKPAAGVMVRLMHTDRTLSGLFDPSGFTDEIGKLRFENLWPGRVLVQSYRGGMDGGQKAALIQAGEETSIQIVVPIGINAHGVVVDQGGNPVAGADLIVVPLGAGSFAAAIAKSGAGGHFKLRSLGFPWRPHIGARARGHAPSPLYPILGEQGDDVEVRIVLGGRGGAVHGRVLDPKGQPVPEAMVQIGEGGRSMIKLPDGGDGMAPLPVRTRTDAEGHFAADGLLPGKTQVAVRALGLAPWQGGVDIPTDGDCELLVHLLPAATIRGTIRDGDGRPLAKVWVQGRSGQDLIFPNRGARSDADGNYCIKDLFPGRWKLTANAKEGNAGTTMNVVVGQNQQWDPVIFKSLLLRGRIVDEKNKPLWGNITAGLRDADPKQKWGQYVTTNKKGVFVLKNCIPDKTIWLKVGSRLYHEKTVYVKPDQKNLVIRMQPMGKPSVYITGQLLDPDGQPAKDIAKIRFVRQQTAIGSPQLLTEAGTGRFKIGPYPPGVYKVFIDAKNYPMVRTDWKELTENETWNLGSLRLQRGGFLEVELEDAEGLVKTTSFSILSAAGVPTASIPIRDGVTEQSNQIPPGTYFLQVADKNCLCARHRFEIHAGRVTPLKVKIERGIPVSLEFAVRNEEGLVKPTGWIRVKIKDATGQVILTRSAWWRGPYDLVRVLDFATRPGNYRVTASTETGERGEATLMVGDKAAGPKRVVLR